MPWWSFLTGGSGREEDRPDYYREGLELARRSGITRR